MKSVNVLKTEERLNRLRLFLRTLSWLIMLGMIAFIIYLYWQGYLTDIKRLRAAVKAWGDWGVLFFVVLHIVEVAIPILPGGVTTLAGTVIFGPFWGFVYNYISICVGSVIGFHIAKTFGRPILQAFFSPKTLATYEKHTNSDSKFAKYFSLAIFFPIAPDDMLCYLAGTTSMSYKQFTTIIVLGKPASLLAYSLGLTTLLTKFLGIG